MALKATTQRFGTKSRQRNAKRSPAQMAAYVGRTYGTSAMLAWQRAYSDTPGGNEARLTAAAAALVPYRYSHR